MCHLAARGLFSKKKGIADKKEHRLVNKCWHFNRTLLNLPICCHGFLLFYSNVYHFRYGVVQGFNTDMEDNLDNYSVTGVPPNQSDIRTLLNYELHCETIPLEEQFNIIGLLDNNRHQSRLSKNITKSSSKYTSSSSGLSLITHFSYICDSDQNYDKYITSSEYRKSPNSSRNLIINNSLARNGFSSEYHIQMYMLEGVMTDLIKPYIIPSDIDIEPSSLSPPPRKNQD